MRRIPRNAAGVGCRGGTSATAGRRAAVYRFELPDGRLRERRSFKVSAPEAVAHLSRHRGEWCFDALRPVGAPGPAYPPGLEVAAVRAVRVGGDP